MSFSAAIVCEDHTLDQFVVRPVVEKLLAAIGRKNARIKVVTKPQLRGYADVRKQACSILRLYGAVSDVVIFAVDADGEDGEEGRPDRTAALKRAIEACEHYSEKGFVVAARQEVEVWALWGSRGEISDSWATVRSERDPKEKYFDPLTVEEDARLPGRGRSRLINKTLSAGWKSFRTGCPELGELEAQLLRVLRGV